MKRLLQIIGWLLNKCAKLPLNIISWFITLFTHVHKGRVVCWAYNFQQYSCNPRYLTEYLLENNHNYEIYWVVRRGIDASQLPKEIKVVRFRTWEYLKLMATAEFLITNARTDPHRIYWHKRREQKYFMLWHAGVALKQIEKDAADKLSFSYIQRAKADSKVCDLMISGCRMQTVLQKEKFWYDGEILERGIPRNDIFFQKQKHDSLRKHIAAIYNIPQSHRLVLYAPTFRIDHSTEPYNIPWDKVIPSLSKLFGGENVSVLVRMHPNLIGRVDTSHLVAYENVADATRYHDMQELLCAADMLITDYSSSMFDFAMQQRPCILYATDAEQYDRGFYFNLRELPFPLTTSADELIETLDKFSDQEYKIRLNDFFTTKVGLCEDGHAAQALAEWMESHKMK